MESIGLLLAPYSDQLVNIAITVTTLQFLSGIFVLNSIRMTGNTDKIPVDPFLGGLVLCLLSIKYGAILGDEGLLQVNFFGFALNLIYLIIYYIYTENDKKLAIWKKIFLFGLFSILCLTWSYYEDKSKVEFRFGTLITGILIILVGMPLLDLGQIIKKKSVEGLPFPIILSGTIVSFTWMLYGLSILNKILVIQNLILVGLGLIQLSLFVIYPSGISTEKKSD